MKWTSGKSERTLNQNAANGRKEIKPSLAATYPLAELPEAQAAFIAKQHTGNIVVTP